MSQERLDTVLRWITLLWVIANSSLGYSYSDSYYRHLGECATAPVRAPDKTSVGNLQVYRTIFPMLL